MKVKVPLLLLLVLAMVVGYLLGTESGREQRDVILVKMGRGPESEGESAVDAESADADAPTDESADAAAEAPAS